MKKQRINNAMCLIKSFCSIYEGTITQFLHPEMHIKINMWRVILFSSEVPEVLISCNTEDVNSSAVHCHCKFLSKVSKELHKRLIIFSGLWTA
jgi:hypothetical protein